MRKKIIILTVFILFLIAILITAYLVVKERGLLFQEKIEHAVIEEKFNISSTKMPLLACIFKITEDGNYWCYNKEGFGFLETDILDTYTNLDDFNRGLIFIYPNGNVLKEYDIDINSIYSKWYGEIESKEEVFSIKETAYTLVDFFSFLKWRELQIQKEEIEESELKNELEVIIESIKKSETFTMFPMSKESLEYICKLVPEDCEYWGTHNSESSDNTVLEAIKKYNIEGDFTDKKETYSVLRTYIIGSSVGSEDALDDEYIQFITKIKDNDESMTDEKIDFLGKYFFRDYFDYSDVLYDGWKNKKEHYYNFLDLVCNIDTCVNIKLNILFDEYKI